MTTRKPGVMLRLALLLVASTTGLTVSTGRSLADELKPMPRIPAGTAFGETPPEDWSHIILFVEGRLGAGDLSAATATVRNYAKLFNLVILADVGKDEEGTFRLNKAGIGFSKKINGLNTVITIDTEEKLGAGLGFIAQCLQGQRGIPGRNQASRAVR